MPKKQKYPSKSGTINPKYQNRCTHTWKYITVFWVPMKICKLCGKIKRNK